MLKKSDGGAVDKAEAASGGDLEPLPEAASGTYDVDTGSVEMRLQIRALLLDTNRARTRGIAVVSFYSDDPAAPWRTIKLIPEEDADQLSRLLSPTGVDKPDLNYIMNKIVLRGHDMRELRPGNSASPNDGRRLSLGRRLSDDTALNSIAFQCTNYRGGDDTRARVSYQGKWGSWGPWAQCESFEPFVGFDIQIEGNRVTDETAANAVRMRCDAMRCDASQCGTDVSHPEIAWVPTPTSWGTWSTAASHGGHQCKDGYFVCGLRTQFDMCGDCDDTAMNDLEIKCCRRDKDEVDGEWSDHNDAAWLDQHTEKAERGWHGSWRCVEEDFCDGGFAMCPKGEFARRFKLRSEGPQGAPNSFLEDLGQGLTRAFGVITSVVEDVGEALKDGLCNLAGGIVTVIGELLRSLVNGLTDVVFEVAKFGCTARGVEDPAGCCLR